MADPKTADPRAERVRNALIGGHFTPVSPNRVRLASASVQGRCDNLPVGAPRHGNFSDECDLPTLGPGFAGTAFAGEKLVRDRAQGAARLDRASAAREPGRDGA